MASRRQVPTFRTRASRWSHAVFMPVAARPVGRLPPSFVAGQQLEPGFGDVPTLSTRQQRFTHVRLTSAHLTGLLPPFAATLTTSAIGPTQLAVVWTLILQSEPEGPTLISCAARLPGVDRYMIPSSRRRGAQWSRRLASYSVSTFPSAPPRTGRAPFGAPSSPVSLRERMIPRTVSVFRISRTSPSGSQDTYRPSPCGRLSRPRSTTAAPSPCASRRGGRSHIPVVLDVSSAT